jgi:hypothetical protein
MSASHHTPRLGLPYPDENDPADVPLDIENLAVALDAITARTPGSALAAAPVLDVGLPGQVRAGRQLTLADFTNLGLGAPAGLWNLSDLTDASGNGRALQNKGAVPFGVGVNGLASTAAQFAGSTAQALYIPDTGAGDPFRLRTFSVGCWCRSGKQSNTYQELINKRLAGGTFMFDLWLQAGPAGFWVSLDGASAPQQLQGYAILNDDRWHFVVATFDGAMQRLYVDGVLDASLPLAGPAATTSTAPLNIGAFGADGATAGGQPFYGRIDEAFITGDVLSLEQIRMLYCAKLAHGFAVAPTAVSLGVRRAGRGAALVLADFPSQPLRLHNFTAGALTDQGLQNVPLINNGAALSVAGADGLVAGAFGFVAGSAQSLSSTDAGLPTVGPRSYGGWVKTRPSATNQALVAYGATGGQIESVYVDGTARIVCANGADSFTGPLIGDGSWHQFVVVEDPSAGDGVKRKLYVDGRLANGSTVLTTVVLAGANRFRIGANPDASGPFTGQLDGVFICDYPLTGDQIRSLYGKAAPRLVPSAKNAGDHVEGMDATNVYATFDSLDSNYALDLAVTA